MKNLALALLSLLALFILAPLRAEDAPTITVRKGDAINVAFKGLGGSDGAAVGKVLLNDLNLSGFIAVGDPARAAYSVEGTAAGGLDGRVVDTRGGVILSKRYTGDTRSMAHQFADDIVETLTGHKGIASSKIAFVSNRSGHKEIYTADYDGANVRQLTSDNTISVGPALSPDRHKLAYTGYQSGYADIYLVDLASGARNRIVKSPGTNSGAAFSPDSARIACTLSKDGNPELYIVGLDGGGARRLTRTVGVESSPTWSPSGGEIIYSYDETGGPQLYRIGVGGGSGRPIQTGYGYCTEPSWAPDGRKVAFNVRSGGSFSVAVLDLGGGTPRIVGSGEDPVFGANSRHLIFSTGSSLVLLDSQNGRTTNIVSGLGNVSEPTWSH